MKIIINGCNGRIGQEINKLLIEGYKSSSLAAGIDRSNINGDRTLYYKQLNDFNGDADCIVDFSNHLMTRDLTEYAIRRNIPLVVATTGQTDEELELIKDASEKVPIFLAANTSLGVALLVELAKMTVKHMPEADIEIIEKHHNRKLDSPSGTALLIANEIKKVKKDSKYVYGRSEMAKREKNEIGIHAIRLGNIVGEHEVIIGTDSQTITLKHEAHDKLLFAEGAIVAAEFLIHQEPGLYGMKDLVD